MASAKEENGTGLLQTPRQVVEAVQALGTLFVGYRKCVRDHQAEKERYKGMFEVWVEETMRMAEKQGEDGDCEEPILVVDETKKEDGGEASEVVADVLLQHKERILDEIATTDAIWDLQAELWAKKCKICRIRTGRGRIHDWRDCERFPEDREAVRKTHEDVGRGMSGVENAGQMGGGFCGGCKNSKQRCWMRFREPGVKSGKCKYSTVVTETVAAILAIGPRMVREWEEREGERDSKRRGEMVEAGEGRVPQRFGCRAVRRVWQTFGWVGVWDIRGAKVNGLKEGWVERMSALVERPQGLESLAERRRWYAVHEGEIGRVEQVDVAGAEVGYVAVEEEEEDVE